MVSKINFTLTQLSTCGLFLGYSNSNWNSRINYFLLGQHLGINFFNLNFTYLTLKKFIFILSQIFSKNGKI
jgi:ribosomal protein S2